MEIKTQERPGAVRPLLSMVPQAVAGNVFLTPGWATLFGPGNAT